jgi:hypothetical protein
MKQKKLVLITVITTTINFKKVYIEALSRRSWDNRYLIVNHTENPEEAREFLNPGHAESVIVRLVNHHSRTYTVEQITVAVSKRHNIIDEDELT